MKVVTRIRCLKIKREWVLFFLTFLIASIAVQGYSIYTYANREWKSGVWCYRVHPLDYIADDCWNLTSPDQYILEAIQNPNEWTLPFDYRDSSFWFTAPWDEHFTVNASERPKPFLYNGTCYNYDVTYAGTILVVKVLDQPPEEYYNVTKPHKYLLMAMKTPGKQILVALSDGLGPHPFKYNGTYYDYSVAFVDFRDYPLPNSPLKPEHTAIGLAVIWIAVGSVYLVKNRKTKAEP